MEWNGESGGFDDFAFKFSNWMSGLPRDAQRLLEECANMGQPILWATLAAREKVVARGVATALRALVGGKALSCIRHPEKQNGFEMWRVLYKEHKPDTATRKVGLLERVMDDQPVPGVDFSDWFLKWLDLVSECERARGRMIDDDKSRSDAQEISPGAPRSPCAREPTVGKCRKKFLVMRELSKRKFLSRQWKLQR